jgi:hypothetical protein
MVPKTFWRRLRLFSIGLAIALAVAVACRHWPPAPQTDAALLRVAVLFLSTFVAAGAVAQFLGGLFAKQGFPPKLEDFEEAHYEPL